MTEQELRALVRDAIARQAGSAASLSRAPQPPTFRQHASHGLFVLLAGADTDGPCIIEPAVPCNHCGYCKSYGH
jgi:hypothetical protein